MKLLKSFSVYTIASIAQNGIGFLLLPIFTYYLNPEDYGTLGLFTIYLHVATVFVALGSGNAITTEYFKLDKYVYKDYFASAIISPSFVIIVIYVCLFLWKDIIAEIIGIPTIWLLMIPLIAFCQYLFNISVIIFRVKDEAISFAGFNLSQTFLNFVLSIFFVVVCQLNWEGRALGISATNIIFGLVAIGIIKKNDLIGKTKAKHVKAVLKYGIPLLPFSISQFVINYADRIFIQRMVGIADLGIYNVGYKIGSIIAIISTAFMVAYSPFVHKSLKKATFAIKLKLVRLSYLFLLTVFLAVIGLIIITPYLFYFLIDERFVEGQYYVPWVALGYFFRAGYSVFVVYVYYQRRTAILGVISFLNIGANFLLNYFFIIKFGAIGAAYATTISYAIVLITIAFISNRYLKMPWLHKDLFAKT